MRFLHYLTWWEPPRRPNLRPQRRQQRPLPVAKAQKNRSETLMSLIAWIRNIWLQPVVLVRVLQPFVSWKKKFENSKVKIKKTLKLKNVAILHSSEKKRFMLDEMFQRNASKFAIFLEYENPHSFFMFHFMLHYFPPNECPGLYWHRSGHSLGGK